MGPIWTIFSIEHLISEWFAAKLVAKNMHQKDPCYDMIGLGMCSKFRYG